jgi:ATP-binding cassette, subfamily B, multidrug efflux pump
MNSLLALNKFLLKYKHLLILGMIFVVTSNIFALILPQFIRIGIEQVVTYLPFAYAFDGLTLRPFFNDMVVALVIFFSIVVILSTLLRGVLMFLMRQTLIVMSRHIEYEQKNELYQHYQALTPAFYKRNNTGDLMSRISEDVSRVRMYTGPAIMYLTNLVAMFIMVIYAMFSINAYLTFWVLLPLPFLSYSIFKVSKIVNEKSEVIQGILSGLTSKAQESYSGIRVIQGYARDEQVQGEFAEMADQYKDESLKLAKVESFFSPLMLLLVGLSTVLALYIGGNEVARGRFTAGNIAEFVIYINMLTWPVASLGWAVSLVQRAAASQRRINQFLDTKPEIENPSQEALGKIQSIVFDKVSFTYPDTGIKALKNVSFCVQAGERVAVVGRTGSGKSTLAELLLRSYDPDKGEILINGQDLKSINLEELREQTGYVPQEVFLFSETVSNNILFGKSGGSHAEVEAYAKTASVYEDIISLPKQFDTVVGERGVMLSGGQKQRISIARALIKDPSLIVLDDCLSAVDARTERVIFSNFENEWKGKTVLLITHRIFAVKDFDKILVLENGRLAEAGTHDQLLEKQGVYAELFQMQQQEEGEL